MYTATAPIPPPKPGSHDISRRSTPAATQSPQQPPLPPTPTALSEAAPQSQAVLSQALADPGENWLPKVLQDKSKHDLAAILASKDILAALNHSASTIHPSLAATDEALKTALHENIELAKHLQEMEARLAHQRSATHAQLLGAHALERSWRSKQASMDAALAPFAPASLYQRLAAGVNEQEQVCQALEESFLDGGGGGDDESGALASEREATEWVRRYREARKLYYLRQERKERWDEGRVGGWR